MDMDLIMSIQLYISRAPTIDKQNKEHTWAKGIKNGNL